jgi:membrane protein
MHILLARCRRWLRTPGNAIRLWLRQDAFSHAGALAFFALFSLAPTLIIAMAVIGVVLGEGAAQGEIVAQLQGAIGTEAAGAIEQAVLMSRVQATGPIPTLLGGGALLIGATTVFVQLRASLNALWGVRPNPAASGLWQLARTRLLGLLVVLLIGLVLLLYFVLGIALSTIGHYLGAALPGTALLMSGGQWLVSLLIAMLFIATLFKVLPDVILAWGDVWLGAIVTALMFAVGRYGIATFLAHTATASIYGAAASLVIVLFWIYYSALILLLGAAFTRALLEARGRPLVPGPGAVRVVQELVASEPA